jgi:hypothetical protein
MTTNLIPIPEDAAERSQILFHLTKPITLPYSEFEKYWPLVNTVFTKSRGLLLQQNNTVEVQKYECRLRKSKKPGKAPPSQNPNGVKKRHGTTIREPGQCNVRIKTTRTLTTDPSQSTVTIERLDDHEHSHDLERSREIAPSGHAIQLAHAEAEKGYSAAQILNALRGVGTATGSQRLDEAGGTHLKRYNLNR